MNRPVLDNRWTWGNVISAITATVTLITVVGGMAWRMFAIDTSASKVDQTVQRVSKSETDIVQLRSDVDMLKQRRVDDVGAMQQMRGDIVGRLDRIEGKLDQKADKQAIREWTK